MHAIEKILARAAGLPQVSAGDIVTARVDFAEINDLYLQTLYSFAEMGGKNVWDSERLAFVFDHYAPSPTIQAAANQRKMRQFAQEQNLLYHFDVNAGVCHQVMPEAGVVLPGELILATDSHTTTHGAFGAFGTGVGATDMATVMISGEIWLRTPEIVEICLEGQPPAGVYAKDVILHVLGHIRADGAIYQALDFTGSYVEQLGVAGRMVLCNMAVEMGAKTAYIQPNDEVLAYVRQRAKRPYQPLTSDADFCYVRSHMFDVSTLEPQVTAPGGVDNVLPLSAVRGQRIDQGLIGTCTGGRSEDIRVAAELLRNRQIPPYIRLLIAPASAQIMAECLVAGYIADLMAAGATLVSPGCGPCLGAHGGVLAPGEVCISASNRNFPGRMGSAEAQIYLASPAAVAVSALKGCITDPRDYL